MSVASTSGNGHHKEYDLPKPHPDLAPDEVIRIVVEALQNNDEPCMDCGLQVAFNFASPANRAVTGPLPRFVEMVKNPMYLPLLHPGRVEIEPIEIQGEHAEQRMRITSQDGTTAAYVWVLSRQAGPAWKDCWMTDSVIRVE
jgi:hypothetical protein